MCCAVPKLWRSVRLRRVLPTGGREAERAVACFLHAESPVLESGDLNEVFSAAADAQK